MKKIKKLSLENENPFRVIESGLSADKLTQFELASLFGGYSGYNYCGAEDCHDLPPCDDCALNYCNEDICPDCGAFSQ